MNARGHILLAEKLLGEVPGGGGAEFILARSALAVAHIACAWAVREFNVHSPVGRDPGVAERQ